MKHHFLGLIDSDGEAVLREDRPIEGGDAGAHEAGMEHGEVVLAHGGIGCNTRREWPAIGIEL